MIVSFALSLSPSLNLLFLVPVPLEGLRLHSSVRWRRAWLSCTCGPPRAHSKSKVALINMFHLLPSQQLSLRLFLSPLTLFSHLLSTLPVSSFTIRLLVNTTLYVQTLHLFYFSVLVSYINLNILLITLILCCPVVYIVHTE